ncbi:TIGR03751 family conjugal transfer lipoprotein [Methylomonas methanica]|uniref:Conjugative transfer region lipoprotein, TIGR03751 family n=1 Tax=Methylomonas methanica (strain DSM 25384 / MC09) TaxID=857087 RepID=G0A5A7_METMM|nr:TIGR03751 family conjugal transfer lipoprotein [Methylomonas methanica]AEG00437.1 conjugative transfer region lipoprotein, TIGR03751 family [Methylomonas methanica MC09]
MSWIKRFSVGLLAVSMTGLLSGCATGDKESILPQDGPTMKEVYQRHFSKPSGDAAESPLSVSIKPYRPKDSSDQSPEQNQNPSSTPYTQSVGQAFQQQFPRLKNPTLIMYVFPHLSRDGRTPVPGYATGFSFYETIEFALPGEAEAGY